MSTKKHRIHENGLYRCGCGAYVEKLTSNGRCRECKRIETQKARQKHRERTKEKFTEWLERISKIPTPYSTLTEEQWMKACKHFGGCAYCGKPDIDVRSMFIPYRYGGRYCAWNIVPSCEVCDSAIKYVTKNSERSVFIVMDNRYAYAKQETCRKYGFTLNNLQKIVDYLGAIMEEINENVQNKT